MASWQPAVGSWACSVSIEPTDGGPLQKGFVVTEASALPGNVFHSRTVGVGFDFASDQYDGYSAKKKIWWETQADSTGATRAFTSANGSEYNQVSSTALVDDDRSNYRELYTRGSDDTFLLEVRRLKNGTWHFYSSFKCRKPHGESPKPSGPAS